MKEKLLKIQQELKAPKNQKNSFGGYNYRSCEDILEAVKPLLNKEKLLLRLNDELVNIGDRYYIKATAIITDGNEVIENVSYAREEENKKGMDGSQITGASSSYARKYALNGLFLIDDVKDSDATNDVIIKTKEDAEQVIVNFGKYKGMTLKEIKENNENYLYWIIENDANYISQSLKDACNMLVEPITEQDNELYEEFIELLTELETENLVERQDVYEYFKVKDATRMTNAQLQEGIDILKKKRG